MIPRHSGRPALVMPSQKAWSSICEEVDWKKKPLSFRRKKKREVKEDREGLQIQGSIAI